MEQIVCLLIVRPKKWFSLFFFLVNTITFFCFYLCHLYLFSFLLFLQTTPEEVKTEKKSDQPPQAKKPKVKTKVVELPIENSPQWQLADDMLNLFVENEVHTSATQVLRLDIVKKKKKKVCTKNGT